MVRPSSALLPIFFAFAVCGFVHAQDAGLDSAATVAELPAPQPAAADVLKEATTDVTEAASAKTDSGVSDELAATTATTPEPPATSGDDGSEQEATVELQGEPIERGPIHEAFAEPLELTPQPTEVFKKAPPATIKELPPERKPDGANVEWISGYWAWDAQREDYVWVSGVWRKKPVGREWVPGRWEQKPGGYQWVPGVWLKTDGAGEVVRQVQEAPPETLEQGPTSQAPSEDHFWIPGVWKHNDQQEYVWRPGFWSQSHSNWVWVPDHYTWTPGGCVFVAGYWDYPWERRGTLYAPCTFGTTVSTRYYYRPTRIIDTNQWLLSLWVGPRYGHYYFGDYYDYVSLGYSPWYSYYGRSRRHYDPFYSYYQWRFPVTYGFGLYGYLDGLYRHNHRHRASRPRVSHHRHDDWARHSRTHGSLYGNVNSLYSHLGRGDYRDRKRRDDYGRGPYYRHYGRGYGGNRIQAQRPQRRELIGYANGKALYSDEIGTGSRAEMGIGRRSPRTRDNVDRDGRRDAERTREGRLSDGRTQDGRGDREPRNGRVDRLSLSERQDRLQTDLLQADRQRRDERARRTARESNARSAERSAERSADRPSAVERRSLAEQQNRLQADRARRDQEAQRMQRAQQAQRRLEAQRQLNAQRQSDAQRFPGRRPNVERRNPAPRSNPSSAITRARQNLPSSVTRSNPSRSQPRSVQPRSVQPRSTPQRSIQPRSNSRPTARATPSRPAQASRSSASRSTPRATRSSPRPSAGFSTSSMKRSRGADRARQAAAMSQRMQQRGGRGK